MRIDAYLQTRDNDDMNYIVGTRIDLSHLNPGGAKKPAERVSEVSHAYESGTRISFLKMAKGLFVLDVVEPPALISISVAA